LPEAIRRSAAVITIDLSGRTGLVLGVANRRSLGWAIAKRLSDAGMRLAFTYQGERMREAVEELASPLPGSIILPCDVTDDEQLSEVFATIGREMPRLDVLVHSVAFAKREELTGNYRDTSRDGWRIALEVSAYSLVAVMRHATPLMATVEPGAGTDANEDAAGGRPAIVRRTGSVIALSYMAAERAVPHYNVMGSAKAALEHAVRQLAYELGPMGIRVNAISAGPVSTLSARGVSSFTEMVRHHRERACLRRSITADEVADSALFLLSDMGSGMTGETMHVDAGYSIVGW
jgi:enoyl-[acyl-carrier protein] reductase I